MPRFASVSAGFSHFVLLADGCNETNPVWVVGDKRFGATPLHPWSDSRVLLLNSSDRETALISVPFFSRSLSAFPASIKTVHAGSRHSIVVTTHGDLYGWGWNEHACLVEFAPSFQASFDDNLISEPTFLELPLECQDDPITTVAIGTERTLVTSLSGLLLVAGSNEFSTCTLPNPLPHSIRAKPKTDRPFSQIKKPYDCINGLQIHPLFRHRQDDERDRNGIGKVTDVAASMFATFITVSPSESASEV